ncbi:DNA-directed RNA polymerase III subunit RPC4 isoform X2 [Acanthochromis polyacanthus]|uniref:DNA-directed RNA polymerase III subunit RPC4 isoform X2 n=1 Tax=Acanthochromis polyacanthus TaxID=80966 RepID=UPI002233E7CE|nr:DNA-directed RNA polymerase III subunit RPC4 isoform X2 [Acanthochromis polyacanthus]
MTDLGGAASAPGAPSSSSAAAATAGTPLSFSAGRGLPGRVRSLASPAPPGRLTSLRTRDLTLGGALKKTKKTFEPNVHAVRKSKEELKEEIHMVPKKERRRERDERRRENRRRKKEKPQTIQSHSIFEQGPADTLRKTGWRSAVDVQDSTTSPVCKLVKKERKESKDDEDENEILSILQRDDFIDDPGLRNDAKLKPIQLPLCQSSSFTKCQTLTTKTCLENPPLFRPPSCGVMSKASHSRNEMPTPDKCSLGELLQDLSLSGREELFFMQLPDCMPGKASGLKVDSAQGSAVEKPAKKEGKLEDKRTTGTYYQAQDPVSKEGCPVLSQFPEGFLGKLQIRKSGKVELKLGDIVMDVSEGAAFSFLQQLVSVRLSEGRTGDMMVLGNVHHKLVLSPDFQALLRQASTQQPQGPSS